MKNMLHKSSARFERFGVTMMMALALHAFTPTASAQIPAAPTNLSATPASGPQIELSWTDNSNDESYFFIYRSTSASGPFDWYDIASGDTTNYTDINIFQTNTYYYMVTAFNEVNESDPSNVDSATLPDGTPATPCCLEGGADRQDVYLAWTDQSYNEEEFIVSRSLSPNGPFTDVGTAPANTCYFVDYQVWDDTTIYYRIRSSNSNGDSAPTSVIQVHTEPY